MIKSFHDADTQALWNRERVKRLPTTIHSVALRKLRAIDAAQDIEDLRVPPGNRLEQLRGDLIGHWSIRVNDQWRIVFVWDGRDAHHIRVCDYH